jgi:hypothetical protein
MKTKLTFILSLIFVFLFSGSVYGDDFQDGMDAAKKKTTKKHSDCIDFLVLKNLISMFPI